jgi:hypothetical protein
MIPDASLDGPEGGDRSRIKLLVRLLDEKNTRQHIATSSQICCDVVI